MTEIEITPAAREWIEGRGGELTLRVRAHYGCCGGSAGMVEAEPGRPEDVDGFDRHDVEGITVYLDRGAGSAERLRVLLEGVWRFRRLFVDGAELVGSRTAAHGRRKN